MNHPSLPVVAFLAATLGAPASAAPPPPVRELLAPGRVTVELLVPVRPPDVVEIAKRMAVAAQENFQWNLDQLRNAAPGEPLPYDPRLGVTREEYERFLQSKPEYTTYGRSTLTLTRRGDHTLMFQGGRGLEDLSGVVLDLRQNRVRTRYDWTGAGETLQYAAEDNLGPRAGHSWKYEKGDLERGNITTASLSIMRLEKTGRIMVDFRSSRINHWRLVEQGAALFTLSAPAKQPEPLGRTAHGRGRLRGSTGSLPEKRRGSRSHVFVAAGALP